mgnify:FL=1
MVGKTTTDALEAGLNAGMAALKPVVKRVKALLDDPYASLRSWDPRYEPPGEGVGPRPEYLRPLKSTRRC